METIVESGVETPVESRAGLARALQPALSVQLLGPMRFTRDGVALALPASRKVRALAAYLALAPAPIARSPLCELLWDIPNDPRGELRWCLSKLRGIVDDARRRRVTTLDGAVRVDLSDCFVDAIEVDRALRGGVETLSLVRLQGLAKLFDGDFLEGLEIDRHPAFNGWLTAQRRRFRATHAALLESLVERLPQAAAGEHLERWLEIAPFDHRVHQRFLESLARDGRIREGDEHVATTMRLFEADGIDCAPVRDAWRAAKARRAGVQQILPLPTAITLPLPSMVDQVGSDAQTPRIAEPRRASIAVMPFADWSVECPPGGAGHALAHDVITRLAKLRSLFVIAEGTVSTLHERRVDAEEAGRMLGVDYVVSGSVRIAGKRLAVSVELAETRTTHIAWAETFNQHVDDAFAVLDEIGNRIVASIASEIETIERNRAILRPPGSLDAWEAHHRGLWHMYRFSRADNERAAQFFQMAVGLDPTFSRAYAGLSFTHFQSVFQGWAAKREHDVDRAFHTAGQALMVDDRDPASHWAMGRAQWLRGAHDASVVELERTIELSPNFALGHYTLAFVHAQAGDPAAAIAAADHSRLLSPFDPMLFAMLGARAMALVRLSRFDEAARWAEKAAARPNAHPHILAIAAFSLALAGSLDGARVHAAAIRKSRPQYGVADYLAAFRYDEQGTALFTEGARRIGMA